MGFHNNVVFPKELNVQKPSFYLTLLIFKVPTDGLVFYLQTNFKSKCGLEKKYYLFQQNKGLNFAGSSGQNLIRIYDKQWTIYKRKFETEEQQIIGFVETDPWRDNSIFGINPIRCNLSEKVEPAPQLLKLTNVSEKKKCFANLQIIIFVYLKYLETYSKTCVQ